MILYKYLSCETARLVLSGGSIQFSTSGYFNDPFDLVAHPTATNSDHCSVGMKTAYELKNYAKLAGILCLTRTPLNPLMWAHYADGHNGVVIGFDADAAGFLDNKSNLIPAKLGGVIYTRHRTSGPLNYSGLIADQKAGSCAFSSIHYEALQRLFLAKPLDWAYEEEVRVVKNLIGLDVGETQNDSGYFSVTESGLGKRYLYKFDSSSIVEIYRGIYCGDQSINQYISAMPNCKIYRMFPDYAGYALHPKPI